MNIEQKITSMEVAEMVGKDHKNLLADLRKYTKQLAELKIEPGDFFTESTYIDANNQSRPCYEVTKKGCEFIAHKLTGVKGTEFTAKYINRFHEMEDAINTGSHSLAEQGISIVKFVADDLKVNTASRILMYENYCKDYGIPTGFLPKYELNNKENVVDAVKRQWRECEVIGEIDIHGSKGIQMLCYFGSSTYDSKEFSVLLNGVIAEMQDIGLQPPPSKEMRKALERLEKNEQNKIGTG